MKRMLSEKKSQGGFEYVLILAGAIIIALVIGAALKWAANVVGQRGFQASQEAANQP